MASQQTTDDASRQNKPDQWEERDEKENFKTPKITVKKRQASSPAHIITTPNPYETLVRGESRVREG